jgi:hypothetical protein
VTPACALPVATLKTLADVDWDERRAELDAILKDLGSRQRNGYDCIIGVSGGKDSWRKICIRELSSMPERVAAFLLHVPRDPPVWRYQESAGERAEREFLQGEGCWTG